MPLPSLLPQTWPMLKTELHHTWLPRLIFPAQHSMGRTWLVLRVYADMSPNGNDFEEIANKVGTCGAHERNIGSILLSNHATQPSSRWRPLEERAKTLMYMRSQWVFNCSIGGLAKTDELMSRAGPRVGPFSGKSHLVDFESYGAVLVLQSSSSLYLQRITLVGLPALGWQVLKPLPFMEFCGQWMSLIKIWADPCPAVEPVAEDELYTNMTLPL